jgi:hypothetical protein
MEMGEGRTGKERGGGGAMQPSERLKMYSWTGDRGGGRRRGASDPPLYP